MNARRHHPGQRPHGPTLGWAPKEHAFRFLAPKAARAWLVERAHPEDAASERVTEMTAFAHPQGLGFEVHQAHPHKYFRYRVQQGDETFDIADPRSTAVARQFAPGHPTWSVAQQSAFLWQGDVRPAIAVHEAIILEVHVRDFTVHPSSGVAHPGTYLGLAESSPGAQGGLNALRDLGVDCVELLPVTAFPLLEPPPTDGGYINPTGKNHWGYMPSFFLAPSERYSLRGTQPQPGAWLGVDDDGTFHDPGDELREMVRRLHRDGIAVVLDLVFNHVSIHDNNPLLKLDPGTWFHRVDAHLRSDSGCGNDLDSRDPAMSALVLDAAVHWMRAYHIDGLRLDLAAILDDATLEALREATRAEYPRSILISEPWSMAGYRPADLARMGHTVWNDRFRNGLKGQNPQTKRGFIFGEGNGGATRQDIGALMAGWPRSLGGLFDDASLTLNYLESHDDLTLGDFIRLGLGEVKEGERVRRDAMVLIQGRALRVHKLAATALLLSRGAVMLAQGQEWGRAKVQEQLSPHHRHVPGHLDGNAYNRDDLTSHLDWRERHDNPELVDHYRRLIALRKSWLIPALLAGQPMRLLWGSSPWSVGYQIDTPRGPLAVLLNGSETQSAWFDLAGGSWWLLLGADDGHIVPTKTGVAVEVNGTAAVVLYATR